jgi:ATP-dependent RNA helicase SUPV3L1/SUV3
MPLSPVLASSDTEPRLRGTGVVAVLGPTNTGKTHLAIERMLAHSSGLIGLPLRLLAREVYGKCVEKVGEHAVALITGEEKIRPKTARYHVCTVEAMPPDLDVAFVAIDEVQLAADLDRGHVFTDRILNRRGREETMLLGAATMRGIIEQLLPGVSILTRPRLSTLVHIGDRKLTRLPRRSAVVAFSADEVYAIAELVRRQRGGTAVVLGALSPRTRNAQVALYQNGDVDYLIATDAIGMGLNLDVDHVAFAADRKFDGYQYRKLNPVELAQIAGRAGRATRDGTFGTTGRCPPFEQELVEQLEAHAFEPVKVLQWRSTDLDFASIGALQASLGVIPAHKALTRAPLAEDVLVLEHCARDAEIAALARTPGDVATLWDVCQVPDYRKIAPAAHAELVTTLYGFLMRRGKVPDDWFGRAVALADRTDGDIDTLSTRIAHVRTWTFVANRANWLADTVHWQGVTRDVEDRLSDALHERLTQRFVDRRTSVLMRRLRENAMLETEITKTGDVLVEGHLVGHLQGFRFAPDASAQGPEAKALRAAAGKALSSEIDKRAQRVSQSNDPDFVLSNDGTLRWIGEPVGKLIEGEAMLKPRIRLIADEGLTGPSREMVEARVTSWIAGHVEKLLGPLNAMERGEDITGIARGIAFQLGEALGVLERQKVAEEMKALDQTARATLRKYGVRFGAYHIYLPGLLKPAPRALAAQLWALKHGGAGVKGLEELPHLAASGRTTFPADKDIPKALYRTVGYRVCGERAVRVDILERLADLIRPALAWKPASGQPRPAGAVDGSSFQVTVAMTSLTGSSGEDFAAILKSLGYRSDKRRKPEDPAPVASAPTVEAEIAQSEAVQSDDPAQALASEGEPTADEAPAADLATAPEAEAAVATADPAAPDLRDAASMDILEVTRAEHGNLMAEGAGTVQDSRNGLEPIAEGIEVKAESAPAEPEMIEVWRPGGRPDHAPRRPHQGRPQQRGGDQRRDRPQGEKPQGDRPQGERPVPAQAAETPPRPFHNKGKFERRDGQRHDRADGGGGKFTPRKDRDGRPERRDDRRDDRPRHGGGKERPRWEMPREAPRERGPDPDSPFAKLLALKAKLEEGKS